MRANSGRHAPILPAGLENLESRVLFSATPLESFADSDGHGPACACCGCSGMGTSDEVHHANDGHNHSDDLIDLGNGLEIYRDQAVPEDVLAEYLASLDGGSGTTSGSGDLFSLDSVPQLSSLPGSTMTIYLDFNGHTTSSTSWNWSFTGGASFDTPAYSIDDDLTTFSQTELDRIEQIWARVAEDYAPFDVNVTTVEPDSNQLRLGGELPYEWGNRVVIGGSSSDWYLNPGQGSAGGVAFVGSFNWTSDTPAYVFEDQLGNGAEKFVAEAISHEVGHTLGLRHHGQVGNEYYSGHGDWAPIMGNSYYKQVTQWSAGEYNNANRSTQYDVDIIGSGREGVFFRVDDHANDFSAATQLGSGDVFASGVIASQLDLDIFGFITTGGSFQMNIDALGEEANLDIEARIYNEQGDLIAIDNPLDSLDANFDLTLEAGHYFVVVDGVGTGDGVSGYSDYGSIGSYEIHAAINAPETMLGDLNGDLIISVVDLDLLAGDILSGFYSTAGDVNSDGITDSMDLNLLVEQRLGTVAGDANLDGRVDLNDLAIIGTNFGKTVSSWTQGDFNADGIVNLADLSNIGLYFGFNTSSESVSGFPALSDVASTMEEQAALDAARDALTQPSSVTAMIEPAATDSHAWVSQRMEKAGMPRLVLNDWIDAEEEQQELFGLWNRAA